MMLYISDMQTKGHYSEQLSLVLPLPVKLSLMATSDRNCCCFISGIHFAAVNNSTLHFLRQEGEKEDETSCGVLINLDPQGQQPPYSHQPADQVLSSSKQDGSVREAMEYLHNEAADSLSVLILVKTKLGMLIKHRLVI